MEKSKKKNKKYIGGNDDIVKSSINLINSMITLGDSIFDEVKSITHIGKDIDTVNSQTNEKSTGNSAITDPVQGPPAFQSPNLHQ